MKSTFLIIAFFNILNIFSQNTYRYIDLNTFKWGVKDISGKIIIEPNYNGISQLKNGRYIVSNESMKEGIIDEKGNEIIPCEYHSIYDEGKDTIIIKKNGKFGVLNSKMDWIIPLKYKHLQKKKNFFIVAEDYLFGMLDSNLNLKVPLMYASIYHPNFNNNYFLAEKNGKRGLVNNNNDTIIPIEYDFLSYIKDYNYYIGGNFINELNESQSKVFDSIGKLIFSIKSNGIHILAKNRFAVKNNDKLWGVFDENSKQKIDYRYNNILSCVDNCNIYIAQNNDLKWGAIDYDGKLVIPFQYKEYFYFKGNTAFVKNDQGKYGFINKKGVITKQFIYDDLIYLNIGYYRVMINGLYGLLDIEGNEIVKPYYDFINSPSNNFVIVGKDKLSYIVNLDSVSNIHKEGYEYIDSFATDKDLILVKKNGLYGFIDYNENVIVPIIYENARPFIDNFASVKSKNVSYIINKRGEKITK